jgi:hypothetical protein
MVSSLLFSRNLSSIILKGNQMVIREIRDKLGLKAREITPILTNTREIYPYNSTRRHVITYCNTPNTFPTNAQQMPNKFKLEKVNIFTSFFVSFSFNNFVGFQNIPLIQMLSYLLCWKTSAV